MTRLCILAVVLIIITHVRVTVLPGWAVPLPTLIVVAELIAGAAFVAWLIHQAHRPAPSAAPSGGGSPS